MKKKVLTTLSIVLILGLAAMGILAYLQSEDSDVNVMTLGNVQIEQIEQERAEDGSLQEFNGNDPKDTGKPAFPAVGPIEWADEGVDVNGTEYKVFTDELKNVVDKIITVKNTGKSDAYVRTIVAIEAPKYDPEDLIHINWNGTDTVISNPVKTTIDGVEYVAFAFTYKNAVEAGKASAPSLMQVFLDSATTNDDCAAFGETWEIVALSQAVQTEGFEDAQTALDTAFGIVDEVNAKTWLEKVWAEYKNKYVDDEDELKDAIAKGETVIKLGSDFEISGTIDFLAGILIEGNGKTVSRADGFTGTMFTVKAGVEATFENITLDGAGAKATGNLISTESNAAIILNEGAVLKNNNGAHAVNLGTRIGATLEINGGEIINNSSDSGAIWGGGHITMNSGKISNNSSTGIGGAIRMVSSCNLTMNGGEICGNTAATDGGAIWGYGSSKYNFNGGKMSNNESAGTGGAIYTGTYSVINISDGFELCDNKAANSGAIRLTDHTSMSMTGGKVSGNTQNGESNAFNTWNNSISITGGELADNMSFVGGLGLTIGAADIDGVITYNLSTNHNTAYLAADFNGFKFKVNEAATNFAAFNFKPASGYTYTAGDEAKLKCMNDGYETYWDAATSTFRLNAE